MVGRESNSIERRRHGLRIPGLPELTGIGCRRYTRAWPFPPHAHLDGMEIVLIKEGRLRWWCDDEALELRGGMVTITPLEHPHGSFDDIMEPCELAWLTLYPAPRGGRPYLGLPRAEGRELSARIRTWPRRLLPAPTGADAAFATMLPLTRSAARDPGDRLRLRTLLLDLLLRIDAVQARTSEAPLLSPPVRRALELITARVREPLRVPELAASAGLSPSCFHRRFRAETGETPAACSLRHRVEAAAARIRTGREGLTAIAAEFGFSSSQYLATCVKRLTGRTPGELRTGEH